MQRAPGYVKLWRMTPLTGEVLIVDQDAHARAAVRYLCSSLGVNAREASDGLQAVESFAASRSGVILMNLCLPGLDGFESARRIIALAGEAPPAIYAVGDCADGDVHARCRDAGMNGFYPRPVSLMEIAGEIIRHLQKLCPRAQRQAS